MLKLKVLGCASGRPHPSLAGSAYLLLQDDRRILFDAGEGLSAALLRNQIDPISIETIFVSHTHSDHIGGLPLYLQMVHSMGRKEPLDIFVPSEAVEPFKQWLNAVYLFLEYLSMPIEIHPIDEDFEFEMTNLKITPHLTTHLNSKRDFVGEHRLSNRMQCYSFVIEAFDRKVVYSSDLGSLNDIQPTLADSDLLIVEGLHIAIADLPDMAISARIRRILLTHLAEDADRGAISNQFAEAGFGSPLFAEEGLEIDLLR